MNMALKEIIELWNTAVTLYENEDWINCLRQFSQVPVSAKIRFNQAVVCCRMNKTDDALKHFDLAIDLDPFLAIAYFERGLLQYSLGRYKEADCDFESTWVYLRGSLMIDYKQLCLQTKLHAAQVLYNRAVVKKCLKDVEASHKLLSQLEKCPKDEEFFMNIDITSLREVIPLNPPHSIFYPPKGFVANLKKKDFLGKAEIVSSVDDPDYVKRKSYSTPSSPTTFRKNMIGVSVNKISAVTTPPNRPPPRLKGHDVSQGGANQMVNVKYIPQRPVPIPRSQQENIFVPVPLKSVPVPNLFQVSQKSVPVPVCVHNVPQKTESALPEFPGLSQTSYPIRKREKPSRPPPPVFK